MKERTKKLMTGYDFYKAYDEQQKIRKKYFKGCEYCEGVEKPIMSRKNWISDYVSLQIKGNKLLAFRNVENLIPFPDEGDDLFEKKYMGYRHINFCPFCGKQLVKNLK